MFDTVSKTELKDYLSKQLKLLHQEAEGMIVLLAGRGARQSTGRVPGRGGARQLGRPGWRGGAGEGL